MNSKTVRQIDDDVIEKDHIMADFYESDVDSDFVVQVEMAENEAIAKEKGFPLSLTRLSLDFVPKMSLGSLTIALNNKFGCFEDIKREGNTIFIKPGGYRQYLQIIAFGVFDFGEQNPIKLSPAPEGKFKSSTMATTGRFHKIKPKQKNNVYQKIL
jgi:hypothetical protein